MPRRNLTIEDDDYAYLFRRAAEREAKGMCDASVSGMVRVLIREAKAIRHDVRGEINGIALVTEGIRRGLYSQAEGADDLQECIDNLVAIIEKAGA